jgi:hypothetical protein
VSAVLRGRYVDQLEKPSSGRTRRGSRRVSEKPPRSAKLSQSLIPFQTPHRHIANNNSKPLAAQITSVPRRFFCHPRVVGCNIGRRRDWKIATVPSKNSPGFCGEAGVPGRLDGRDARPSGLSSKMTQANDKAIPPAGRHEPRAVRVSLVGVAGRC